MLKTWISTAFRVFVKHRAYSIINIVGLSLGMCCAVGIYLFVLDELSFDHFQINKERIYRINAISTLGENTNRYATTTSLLADAIKTDMPEAENVVRVYNRQGSIQIIKEGEAPDPNSKFREENFVFADPEIFEVFTFQFLKGSASAALINPNQVVITRKMAVKYFGSVENSVGKEILFEEKIPMQVSAVIENYPDESNLKLDIISHFENFYNVADESARSFLRKDWLYNPTATFLLLGQGYNASDALAKLNMINKKYADERVKKGVTYELQPLDHIHLYSNFSFANDNNNIKLVFILSSVGLLILLIACINFINLSTVHSLKRAKEIGVRKVLGATKKGLATQFLGETTLLVCLSFVLAIVLLYLIIPSINEVSGKNLEFSNMGQGKMIISLLIIFIVTSLLAGTYPAFYITRFNPAKVLKGIIKPTRERFEVRKVLIVFQFSIAIVMVIATLVVNQQMKFAREKELGFQKENMITVPLFSSDLNSILGGGVDGELRGRMNAFEQELAKYPVIEASTVSSVLPGTGAVNALIKTDKLTEEDNVFLSALTVDFDFLEAYKISVVAGRGFSREFGTDHLQAFIINQQALNLLGWETPEKALGQNMELMGKKGTVVGVVKDFHIQGLQQVLQPLAMEVAASKFTVFTVRIAPTANLPEAISTIKKEWDKMFPEKVFEYHLLGDQLQTNYEREDRLGKLVNYFSVLSIVISGIGLFGLAAFINHQRIKEVSLRKVLGATTSQVFYILSLDFMKMLLAAIVIAFPLAYFLSLQWLGDFAYRISLGWVPFSLAALTVFVIMFVTTVYHILQTSKSNPADTLRNE